MEKKHELKVVSIRLVDDPPLLSEKPTDSPKAVVELMAKELEKYDRELFCILNMKTQSQVINMNIVTMGSLDAASIHPREVFKSSILSNAAYILLLHNHPSGLCVPSKEDELVTKRLKKCGDMLGIHVMDHIIVGDRGQYFSFRESGIIFPSDKAKAEIAAEGKIPCHADGKRR